MLLSLCCSSALAIYWPQTSTSDTQPPQTTLRKGKHSFLLSEIPLTRTWVYIFYLPKPKDSMLIEDTMQNPHDHQLPFCSTLPPPCKTKTLWPALGRVYSPFPWRSWGRRLIRSLYLLLCQTLTLNIEKPFSLRNRIYHNIDTTLFGEAQRLTFWLFVLSILSLPEKDNRMAIPLPKWGESKC